MKILRYYFDIYLFIVHVFGFTPGWVRTLAAQGQDREITSTEQANKRHSPVEALKRGVYTLWIQKWIRDLDLFTFVYIYVLVMCYALTWNSQLQCFCYTLITIVGLRGTNYKTFLEQRSCVTYQNVCITIPASSNCFFYYKSNKLSKLTCTHFECLGNLLEALWIKRNHPH